MTDAPARDAPPADAEAPAASRAARIAVAAYVGLQILIPLPSWWAGLHETEGSFSWNMYAHHYSCEWAYETVSPEDEHVFLDPRQQMRVPAHFSFFLHRRQLRTLHDWACEEAVEPDGKLVGFVRCALLPGEAVDLVRRNVNLCRAPGRGVRVRP